MRSSFVVGWCRRAFFCLCVSKLKATFEPIRIWPRGDVVHAKKAHLLNNMSHFVHFVVLKCKYCWCRASYPCTSICTITKQLFHSYVLLRPAAMAGDTSKAPRPAESLTESKCQLSTVQKLQTLLAFILTSHSTSRDLNSFIGLTTISNNHRKIPGFSKNSLSRFTGSKQSVQLRLNIKPCSKQICLNLNVFWSCFAQKVGGAMV